MAPDAGGGAVSFMTIGEFADTTRLSPKALRLYDQLGLVVPARVDPSSGYRLYSHDQVEAARLVGTLRRLDMPLTVIASVLEMKGPDAAAVISGYWQQVEAVMADRRALASYLQARLRGDDHTVYDIEVRQMPERKLLTISRHVTLDDSDAFFDDAFSRLRSAGPGIKGIEGVPFLVFYGEVSDDSDGPIELCRPVAIDSGAEAAGDMQLRVEAAHDEAYIRLALKDMAWPAMLPACDALANWVSERRRQPAGPLRQLLMADQRTAKPDTLACDLSVPLR
jgi:DNA-binding transcriptional MerR regulator